MEISYENNFRIERISKHLLSSKNISKEKIYAVFKEKNKIIIVLENDKTYSIETNELMG